LQTAERTESKENIKEGVTGEVKEEVKEETNEETNEEKSEEEKEEEAEEIVESTSSTPRFTKSDENSTEQDALDFMMKKLMSVLGDNNEVLSPSLFPLSLTLPSSFCSP
jgi:hypothetical protein